MYTDAEGIFTQVRGGSADAGVYYVHLNLHLRLHLKKHLFTFSNQLGCGS